MADSRAEIDLLELFVNLNLLIKRNALIVVLALITGASLGFLYYEVTPAVYEGRMIISSDLLTESLAAQIHGNINHLRAENNLAALSSGLSMSEHDVAGINRIAIEQLEDRYRIDKDLIDKDFVLFRVTLSVYDKSILPTLQTGIVNHLRSNEFLQKRMADRKQITEELLQRIDNELHDLEQLKERIAKARLFRDEKEEHNTLVFDPSAVHGRIIQFSTERGKLKTMLQSAESIQVVESITVFNSPVSPKLYFSLAAGALFGLLCAASVIVIKVLRNAIERTEEKRGRP